MVYEDLNITTSDSGSILPVRAYPGSSKVKIDGVHDGMLRVYINAQPEKGKANDAVIKILSETLGISKSEIELVKGETSRKKTFLIHKLTPEKIIERLSN